VEKFAYINIDPNNGGSVLNVSEGGLCFHSIAPAQPDRTIRFWFSENNRRIEVDGELAWMDETRKTGGLQFTTLPKEARELMRNWMTPSTTPPNADEACAPSVPLPRTVPVVGASQPPTKAAFRSPEPLAVVSPRVVSTPLRGFSGGLATGFLVSALVVAAFLFQSHRRQLGESLIQLGERLAAKPQRQMQPVSPAAQTPLPAWRTASPAAVPIPVPRRREPPAPPSRPPGQRSAGRIEPAKPLTAAVGSLVKGPVTPGVAAISSMPPTISMPTTAVALVSNLIPGNLRSIPTLEPESHPSGRAENLSEETARAIPGIYLEVSKFKDDLGADKARERLTRLGFHATVIQKGHLWMNSYYVLVGPYAYDKAEAARKKLVSYGFKPRAFERGSRNFPVYGGCDTMRRLLRSGSTLNGVMSTVYTHRSPASIPVEECLISWESYSAHTIVKFVQNDYVIATAYARWVNRDLRFDLNAFVYRKNDDGSRTLLEIQFAGMSQALVFDKSS
jgi:hypothetical protein